MGTRSRIGVMHGEKCKSVYCHWDGYLAHNGAILQEHYDSSKANHLVALGNISSLKATIGEAHPFSPHNLPEDMRDMTTEEFEAKFGNMTTFYMRDRSETEQEFEVSHSFDEFLEQCIECGAEYYYIMKDGEWYCGDTYAHTPLSMSLTLLTEALATEKETA